MRRHIGRHKKNSGKLAAIPRSPREREVTAVDRIKRTAEKTDIHARLVSSFAGLLGKRNLV